MKELAEKQQRAAQKSPKPQTPPSSPVRDHSPTPTPQLDPSSLPPGRAETPLERTLLEMLNDKDLGATGFVTADELAAVLGTLPDNKAVSVCVCVHLCVHTHTHKMHTCVCVCVCMCVCVCV